MERTCANCGAKSNEDTRFCTKCGAPYPTLEEGQRRIANEHLAKQPQTKVAQVRYVRKPMSFLRILSAIISIIFLVWLGYFAYLFFVVTQPTPTLNQSSTPIMVSASQLMNDYGNNE